MKKLLVSGISLALTLVSCGGAGPSVGGGTGGSADAYTVRGVVRDAQGRPLAGVEVFADNTAYDNMNALGTTDASGRYVLHLPQGEVGTWRAGAHLTTIYHGVPVEYALHPNETAAFTAAVGAVRDFEWRLSGQDPQGNAYGSPVWVYMEAEEPPGEWDFDRIEVTLTPDGPLADGSAGQTITAFLQGGQLPDVPVGRYQVAARYLGADGAIRPVSLKPRGRGAYAQTVTADFQLRPGYGVMLELQAQIAP